jgi:hypothetical protein
VVAADQPFTRSMLAEPRCMARSKLYNRPTQDVIDVDRGWLPPVPHDLVPRMEDDRRRLA